MLHKLLHRGGGDLFRAAGPTKLVEQQKESWAPDSAFAPESK